MIDRKGKVALNTLSRYLVTASVLLLLVSACGGSRSSAELIVGKWDAVNQGETMRIEFRSDGVALQEGEEQQRYRVIEGDVDTLQILEMGGDDVIIELELAFDGDDSFTLSGRGMTATLARVE